MALWSAPVYAEKITNLAEVYNDEIKAMRNKISKATEAKGRKRRHKAKKAKRTMINTLSNTRKFPGSLGLDQYIDKIKDVKFGLKKDDDVDEGIESLTSILDEIETYFQSKELAKRISTSNKINTSK